MNKLSHDIHVEYHFLEEKDFFNKAEEIDIPLLLRVDADFKIFIDNILYFEEPIAIFEFYYALREWKIANDKKLQNFNYYSIEYDESIYKDGAVISLLINNNTAQIKTLWERNPVNNIFELNYAVKMLIKLEERLHCDIEDYFGFDALDLFERESY